MGSYNEQQAIQHLIDLLRNHSESDPSQEATFAALIEIGEPTITPLVEAITAHAFDSLTTRIIFRVFTHFEVVRAGDSRVVDLLITLLNDEDIAVASDASIALGIIADPRAVLPLIDVLRNWKNFGRLINTMHALAAIGEPAIASLLATLKDPNPSVRWDVIHILGEIGHRTLVAPLIDMLQDENANVRATAAEALAKIGDTTALEPIKALLKDVDTHVRVWAVNAITDLGGSAVFDYVVNALHDPTEQVRRAAVAGLGKINDLRGVDLLLEALNDPSEMVICEAIDNLCIIDDERVLPALTLVQQKYSCFHEEHYVRFSVTKAIQRIRGEIDDEDGDYD